MQIANPGLCDEMINSCAFVALRFTLQSHWSKRELSQRKLTDCSVIVLGCLLTNFVGNDCFLLQQRCAPRSGRGSVPLRRSTETMPSFVGLCRLAISKASRMNKRVTTVNRLREIERETISSSIKSGAPRWEAFRAADELTAGIRHRLAELQGITRNNQCAVLPMAAAGGRL